jgi:hypothetical protein
MVCGAAVEEPRVRRSATEGFRTMFKLVSEEGPQ